MGGVTGEVRISQWWTGTTCETVNFPSVRGFVFSLLSFLLLLCSNALLKCCAQFDPSHFSSLLFLSQRLASDKFRVFFFFS